MREKTVGSNVVFEGRILRVEVLDVELPDGKRTTREIVRHGPAVAVIARRKDGQFVFIKQFRKAMERICFEVIAGNCDHGEEAKASAIRELKEETGYVPLSIRFLSSIYPSMGYCDERIDIFYAEVNNDPGETDFDPDEEIETILLTEEKMDGLVRRGEVQDAKTLAAWMLYKASL